MEKKWIDSHPVIRIGVDPCYAPYSFRDESGQYQGIAMEFAKYFKKELGLTFKVVPDLTWPNIVEGVREKK